MPNESPASLDLALTLPLGVMARQLFKIEADLRSLNMTALGVCRGGGVGGAPVAARLEEIHDALDRIRALLRDLEVDIRGTKLTPVPSSAGGDARGPSFNRED